MNERFDIAVHGAGAWGTALAVLAATAGKRVALVARAAGKADEIATARHNPRLPNIDLPPHLAVTAASVPARYRILASPFQHLRGLLERLPRDDAPLILACKGLEAATGLLGPEIAASLHEGRPLAILTGPNFAHEIAAGLPAAAIIAAADARLRRDLVTGLAASQFRLYGSADITGAAIGGAAKNVIAIAAGVVIGAGFGENARAALVTRGLAEIARFAIACGGKRETMAGLAGLGDLLLTCTGPASRNYRFGLELGRGESASAILTRSAGVIEGTATAPALQARAGRLGVEMPVTEAVVSLINGAGVATIMRALLARAAKDE